MNVMIKAIQDRRLQKGYNFHDIERATGIPAKRMHSFEKGQTHLSLEETERLFEFLNLKHSDLVFTKKRKGKPKLLIFTTLITILFISLALYFIFSTKLNLQQITDSPTNNHFTQHESDAIDPMSITNENEVVAIESPVTQGTRLRFWGNVQYQSEQLPQIAEPEKSYTTYDIVPIERLHQEEMLPNWLTTMDKEHLLLNLATRFIWGDGIQKERDRLNKLGFKNVGLDYQAEVFKPFILETVDGKVGILPFTRTILEVGHIAEKNRIGLAKVYDRNILMNAIIEAKKEVEVLVVLIGWGDREAESGDITQKELALEMINSGADLIVGNHSIHGQEIDWIDGVPVFYSLGHTISDMIEQEQETYSYVLDIDLVDRAISQIHIHIGRLRAGVLTFDLSEQEKAQVEQRLFPLSQKSIQTK